MILLDHISVPKSVSYGTILIDRINVRFGNKRFISAASLDSRTSAGRQVADLIASAAYYARTKIKDLGVESYSRDGSPQCTIISTGIGSP